MTSKQHAQRLHYPKNTYLSNRIPHVLSEDGDIVVDTSVLEFDCDYLPSLGGNIPCLYKPVTCKSPPTVKNATMFNVSMTYNNYSVLDEVDYSCNEGFEINGNTKISCMYTGEWSPAPECSLPSTSTTHSLGCCSPSVVISTTDLVDNSYYKKSN